jgi:hypothetical protein
MMQAGIALADGHAADAENKHMGVATCANSVCHSIRLLEEDSNIRQNEYATWLFHDRHSIAYKTLLSPRSKQIAQKLGLESAATADICLDCHADNVSVENRGPEFHMSDGVGCEACHGGSQKWIGTHTIKPYDQQRNLNDGMYPTAPLHKRAELCASCHVGNDNKFATHRIMGAGHPRLSFELDTFSNRQPEHYDVDEDYLSRKNRDDHLSRLLVGTAIHARTVAENLSGKLINNPQGHPEIALYDCHSCHQSLANPDWRKNASSVTQEPGTISLNDSSFILLGALTGAVDAKLQAKILNTRKALQNAAQDSVAAVVDSARQLQLLAIEASTAFAETSLSQEQVQQMLKEVMYLGVRGEYGDYIAAEQAVMAMDALSFSLPNDPALKAMINQAYKITENDESYRPTKLQKVIKEYRANL